MPLFVAAFALGVAIAVNIGMFDDRAIAFLLMASLSLAWAYAAAFPPAWYFLRSSELEGRLVSDLPATLLAPMIWVILATSLFWGWNDRGLLLYPQKPWSQLHGTMTWMLVLLATYLPAMLVSFREPRWVRLLRFVLFALLVLEAGIQTLKTSPVPAIDVWTVQQQGAEALLHGKNPYTYVNVADTTPGRLGSPTPYVYPPTQALAGVPGFKFFGDVRYSMLFAMLTVGVGLRLATWRAERRGLPAIVEDGPALLVWCGPKVFFVLEQSWVDPVQLMFLTTACVLFLYEKRLAGSIAFGIACSSKQTLFWVVPLAGFCLRFRRREWVAMLVAAAIPVLPFLLVNFAAIRHANVDFLRRLPPRADGLTLANWLDREYHMGRDGESAFYPVFDFLARPLTPRTGHTLGDWFDREYHLGHPWALAFPLGVVGLASWKLRGLAAFAIALAFTYMLFFAWSKWAFANYYYFVGGLAALAAACVLSSPGRAGYNRA